MKYPQGVEALSGLNTAVSWTNVVHIPKRVILAPRSAMGQNAHALTRWVDGPRAYTEGCKRHHNERHRTMEGSTASALEAVLVATKRTRLAAIDQALAVCAAREAGCSWRAIGELWGVSAQAAHNRWAELCADHASAMRPIKGDRWLTEAQVSSLLGIDLTTFRALPVQPPSKPDHEGTTRYYRQSHVIAWVNRQPSVAL